MGPRWCCWRGRAGKALSHRWLDAVDRRQPAAIGDRLSGVPWRGVAAALVHAQLRSTALRPRHPGQPAGPAPLATAGGWGHAPASYPQRPPGGASGRPSARAWATCSCPAEASSWPRLRHPLLTLLRQQTGLRGRRGSGAPGLGYCVALLPRERPPGFHWSPSERPWRGICGWDWC